MRFFLSFLTVKLNEVMTPSLSISPHETPVTKVCVTRPLNSLVALLVGLIAQEPAVSLCRVTTTKINKTSRHPVLTVFMEIMLAVLFHAHSRDQHESTRALTGMNLTCQFRWVKPFDTNEKASKIYCKTNRAQVFC